GLVRTRQRLQTGSGFRGIPRLQQVRQLFPPRPRIGSLRHGEQMLPAHVPWLPPLAACPGPVLQRRRQLDGDTPEAEAVPRRPRRPAGRGRAGRPPAPPATCFPPETAPPLSRPG